jgi:PIN domain nuclease of toxin-antitoxin system
VTLLVDTHIFLWAAIDDPRLRGVHRSLFADPSNVLLLSVTSLWEVAIKYSLGKLPLPVAPADFFAREVATRRYGVLPVIRGHAERVATLRFPPDGHRDPFDRLLVAQAIVEGIALLSGDGRLAPYEADGLHLVGT